MKTVAEKTVTAKLEIQVNGDPRSLEHGTTVLGLITDAGLDPRLVAVEHNGEILPRERYQATALEAGDRIEIVRFVQGG